MKTKEISWEPYKYHFDDDTDDKSFDDDDIDKIPTVMRTPIGVYRVDDQMNPFRQFSFWMGSTNFSITPQIKSILEKIDGVEVLLIITRYRFIVAAGKMFDFTTVKNEIETVICNKIVKESSNDEIIGLKKKLEDNFKYWAIYVLPNGKIEHIESQVLDHNFENYLALYQEVQAKNGGKIIKYQCQE